MPLIEDHVDAEKQRLHTKRRHEAQNFPRPNRRRSFSFKAVDVWTCRWAQLFFFFCGLIFESFTWWTKWSLHKNNDILFLNKYVFVNSHSSIAVVLSVLCKELFFFLSFFFYLRTKTTTDVFIHSRPKVHSPPGRPLSSCLADCRLLWYDDGSMRQRMI